MLLGDRYIVESAADAYKVISNDLLNASSVSPRGISTKELIAPQIVIQDPRQRLVYNKERNYNIMHAIAESIMLFSPSDKVDHIAKFNKNMANFSDDGVTMYGSYGKRISGYIEPLIDKLTSDKDTRQAVLTIHKIEDLVKNTKDVPCTSTLQFLIRDNKLHLIVNMRSNDILYGFQYDVFMFTMLQETIANTLGVNMGYYIHQPSSLHVYEKYNSFNGYEMLETMATDSTSISVYNDGKINDWFNLADFFTGEDYLLPKSIIGDELTKLVAIENMYRKNKEAGFATNLKKYFNNVYRYSPEWAKAFLSKWENI